MYRYTVWKFHSCYTSFFLRCCSTDTNVISINNKIYQMDNMTNVTPRVLTKIGTNLHSNKNHPLGIISERIKCFFYQNYRKPTGTPVYSMYDNFSPVVSVKQNFDDLLIPSDHISRQPSDSYYINSNTMLRAHTSAHEADLIKSGLDGFLIFGDVYRRDEIDLSHYPVFHQVEGVRLFNRFELFNRLSLSDPSKEPFILNVPSNRLSSAAKRLQTRQEKHSELVGRLLQEELKSALEKLAVDLFGREIRFRWVPAYFPWTHPSFELEIEVEPDNWMEMLGCGIIEQDMLEKCGASDKVGIAFGLGLERWAMKLFNIPDIRLFWSNDDGFLHQFQTNDINKPIKYKPISIYPPCVYDISFWLPDSSQRQYHINDFYELVGNIAGDMVERVELVDEYINPKSSRKSHCYRIFYRHMSKNLTHSEVSVIHEKVSQATYDQLGCTVR